MNEETAQRLQEIVAVLDQEIAALRALGLHETAMMLGIAKLDLQTRIHGISDDELRALTNALEVRRSEPAGPTVIDLMTRRARK